MMGVANKGGTIMYAWKIIKQFLDFVDGYLAEEISPKCLASVVGLSPCGYR